MSETRFNPPPHWPVPKGWTPSADWRPDPTWPPAPPGWQFWVPDTAVETVAEAQTDPESPPAKPSRPWWYLSKGTLAGIVTFAVVVAVGLGFIVLFQKPVGIRTMPQTRDLPPTYDGSASSPITPDWGGTRLYVDFAAWSGFGGIDANFSNGNASVRLDTHDTTDSWRTKWSGLISPLTTGCAMRIVGRVRDISHTLGVPGGFGIGVGSLGAGDADSAELTGTSFQFDFGQRGYRSAVYPSDIDAGLTSATLDHEWHQIDVVIKPDSRALSVDGQLVTTTLDQNPCGQPFIRVWAGAAEFADFTVTPIA
ncbi:hypothetical protein DVS77_18535 [Mycolicibacterium moriokaense]|nr:hypothetical protein DVS77_18535 [Mycolicibacterium moriokaense]